MTDREKLIEMLKDNDCPLLRIHGDVKDLANYLIANGVTFAKDINVPSTNVCGYCQEDADGYRRIFGAFSITNPFHGREWFINTRHCKPRQIYFCPICGRMLSRMPKEV